MRDGVVKLGDMMRRRCISIIIVSWNTNELTARCLRSIARQIEGDLEGEVEVIVVDNASSDGSSTIVRRDFPWVHLISNDTNVGFARANNQAIESSQGELILLLNSDTEVKRGAVAELAAFMGRNPRAGAAGAMLLNQDGSLQESCRPMLTPGRELWRLSYLDRLLPRATYRMRSWNRQVPRQVESMMGACMMLRRHALVDVGALDERYFMYTEEVDLCYRLSHGQWELWYVPAAKVTHFGQASSRQVEEDMFVEVYRSKVQFYRKTGGEGQAERFKRMVRAAYLPRLGVAKLLAPISKASIRRAVRYARLLQELADM